MAEEPTATNEMFAGETRLITKTVTDSSGNNVDLSAVTLEYRMFASRADNADLEIYKDNGTTGGVVVTTIDGEYQIQLLPADTTGFSTGVRYHELRITYDDGDQDVHFHGDFLIMGSKTDV